MRTLLLSTAFLLMATLSPSTCHAAADFPGSSHQKWDARVAYTSGADSGASGSCAIKLRPAGQCGGSGAGAEEGEECPYQVTLPPLTVQLPKQFRLLEKAMKELQSLKEVVNKLKSSCQECGGGGARGSGVYGSQQADQGQTGNVAGLNPSRQDVQSGASQEERDNGMVSGANVEGAGGGHGHHFGKIAPGPSSMQEMQVRGTGRSKRLLERKVKKKKKKKRRLNIIQSQFLSQITSLQFTFPPPNPAVILAPRDCSDYNVLETRKNGVYRITPDPRNGTFEAYCDMESFGGGWTVIQQRLDGSTREELWPVSGEFWLGNDHIHLLTKAKDMTLRIELEDFEGVREYAKYDQFYVANDFLSYRLSISGYSGTAGNAISFNKHFNHDQKFFSTPDRDNDMYPSGNCGAYYSSGWWFDACMSANLNGKYYHKRYKGVRNGIFWGTWHNMSTEYYPTNYRQAFKTVKMMIRPKNYVP
uniref:Fibrinogen-like 2a n=1 Tax=Hippocampus comes TaxID=109280 RepID=A0A3Q2YUI4_HIPCM